MIRTEVHAEVSAARFSRRGFRSPTAWLATTTRDRVGQCKHTLHLATTIQVMPVVKAAFAAGDPAERTVSDSLFDVLVLRDHGCRWEGCGMPVSACDAHHAVHWADDGAPNPRILR